MEITEDQLNELRLGALTAIDGLWFLALEKKLGFDKALEADVEVWKQYGIIFLKRLSRMLDLKIDPGNPLDLETISFMLETMCRVDGTECEWEVVDENTSRFLVHHCSWYENLRRAGRENTVPCELIDNTMFRHWLDAIDPAIKFEVTHSLPRGDKQCNWVLKRQKMNTESE